MYRWLKQKPPYNTVIHTNKEEHTHDAQDPRLVIVTSVGTELDVEGMIADAGGHITGTRLYSDIMRLVGNTGGIASQAHALPSVPELNKRIYSWNAAHQGTKSPLDMLESMKLEDGVCSCLLSVIANRCSGGKFYCDMSHGPNGINHIIFHSDFQLWILGGTPHLFVDCTFSFISKPFKQLLILLSYNPATALLIPTCYALLRTKEKRSYKRVFEFLASEVLVPVKHLTTDFEVRASVCDF